MTKKYLFCPSLMVIQDNVFRENVGVQIRRQLQISLIGIPLDKWHYYIYQMQTQLNFMQRYGWNFI